MGIFWAQGCIILFILREIRDVLESRILILVPLLGTMTHNFMISEWKLFLNTEYINIVIHYDGYELSRCIIGLVPCIILELNFTNYKFQSLYIV